MELVNHKIARLNQEAEKAIDHTQTESEQAVQEIYQLEGKLETYDRLIDAKDKQNKASLQHLITHTEELEHLGNRKQYVHKLLEAELAEQRDMTRTYGELESISNVKQQKLMFVVQENQEYEKLIAEEKDRQAKNREELLRLKNYLQTLLSTNEHLYLELEKSCSQDRGVQVMLSDKLEKLMVINDKIAENEIMSSKVAHAPLPSPLFRERNLSPKHSLSPKASYLQSKLVSQAGSPRGKDTVMESKYLHSG